MIGVVSQQKLGGVMGTGRGKERQECERKQGEVGWDEKNGGKRRWEGKERKW